MAAKKAIPDKIKTKPVSEKSEKPKVKVEEVKVEEVKKVVPEIVDPVDKARMEQEVKQQEFDRKLKALYIEKNIAEVKNQICPVCGASLEVEAEAFLAKGTRTQPITCKKCDFVSNVMATFKTYPDACDVIVKVDPVGYAYAIRPISDLSDEQVFKRVEEEAQRVRDGTSQLNPHDQLMYRTMSLLKK